MKLTKDEVYQAIETISSAIRVEDLLHYYGIHYDDIKGELKMQCIDVGHNDNNPSMNFNVEKKRYNCLSCDAHGNWYTFVKNAEIKLNDRKLSVAEKLRIGAEIANITVEGIFNKSKFEEESYETDVEHDLSDALDSDRKQNETFNDDVLKQFYRKKNSYFIDRGYKQETLDYLEMGFGVKGRSKDRCIFPVRNMGGELIGWSGRSVINNPQIKWLHEPEGRFLKGLTLYNIDKALPHIIESGEVYVYESIGNVARAIECGMMNCVATLGNKMTTEQANMLADIAERVYICGDPDAGGHEMNILAINMLYGRVELYIAITDFGYDENGKPLDYGDVGKSEFDNNITYIDSDEYNTVIEEVFITMLESQFEKDYKIKMPNGKQVLCTNELKDSVDIRQLTPEDILFFKSIDNSFDVKRITML